MEIFTWDIWLYTGVILLILEIVVPGFVISCFAPGAFVAALVAGIGLGAAWQLIFFCAVTISVFIFLRPFVLKYLGSKDKGETRTNAPALRGKQGVVLESIDHVTGKGTVRIDGDVFPARSHCGDNLATRTVVRVVEIDSIVLVVEPI